MKRIAFLLLFIFSLVQAGPAIAGLLTEDVSVFIVDEEKTADKSEVEKKDAKKDLSCLAATNNYIAEKVLVAIHQMEKIHPSPCIEKVSPPPNLS